MDELRHKWDQRYRAAPLTRPVAMPVLRDNVHLLPTAGRALDLACGRGGNALLLAARGLVVDAWDLSPVAVDQLQALARDDGLPIEAAVRDVVASPPPAAAYDVIAVGYFLERDLAPAIARALRPRGLLFYQTFGPERIGAGGPRSPGYRLAAGELLRLFPSLRPRVYREEGMSGDTTRGLRGEAMFVGERL